MLILAGVTILTLTGENGLLEKAETAKEKTDYATAKESLQLLLLEIKTRVITEEKRKTKITDCNELEGKDGTTKIEYKNGEIASTEIQYALVTYKNYIFNVDNKLNIIEEQIYDEETLKYKKVIAQTLTDLGVETSYKQSAEDYIKNIKILEEKSYEEGKESDIVLLKTDLNSRYVQELSLSNIEGYENFDEDDFIIGNKNILWIHQNDWEDIANMSKSYNKETGALTLGKQKAYASKYSWTFCNTYDLYATKRKVKKVTTSNLTTNTKENLNDFKNKLIKVLEEKYGIENNEENPLLEKTEEEISEYIKKIAKKKYKEGIATYMILIQENLSTRYNQTVKVTNIEGYENLTIDDFFIVNKNLDWTSTNDGQEISVMTKSYNPSTGTLEFGIQKSYSHIFTFWNNYDVYLLKKQVINLENNQ